MRRRLGGATNEIKKSLNTICHEILHSLLTTVILAGHKIKHVITIFIGLITAGNLSKGAIYGPNA